MELELEVQLEQQAELQMELQSELLGRLLHSEAPRHRVALLTLRQQCER